MLFTNIPCQRLRGRDLRLRRGLVREILADFRRAFVGVHFELDEASATVNAQAFMRADRRIVRLYGGLAYHAAMGADGLVFTLLHEAGHHLSSGGRLAGRDELACECAADRWALSKGASRLRKETGRCYAVGPAVRSLDGLAGPEAGERSDAPPTCWAMNWSKRKRVLVGPEAVPPVRRCALPEFFASETKHF
jgi:hypothetical protein